PQEKRILEFTGTIEGQDLTELTFRALVGSLDEKEELVSFDSVASSVLLKRSFFNLSFLISGKDVNYVSSGGKVSVSVPWKNKTNNEIRDAIISVKLKGVAVDEKTITSDNGFYRGFDTSIVWNSSSFSKLNLIAPGEEGLVNFSFSLKDVIPVFSQSDKNFSLVLDGEMTGSKTGNGGQGAQVRSTVSRELKISTDAQLTSRIVYTSGSLPPQVGKKTVYTIFWTVENLYNDISNSVIRATMPSYVSWVGEIDPMGENVSYNPSTGEIAWRVDNIKAGSGAVLPGEEVSFQVSFVPALNQLGSSPEILSRASFEGKDTFTGTILRDLSGILTIKSISEINNNSLLGSVIE
ncbi:hypothetical protein ACFLZC_03150, partial [Patescibacteria group bacterium]